MAANLAATSFLFSLYGNDAHTAAAHGWVRPGNMPVTLTALTRYELGNALRFAAYRKIITPANALSALAAFESDLSAGYLRLETCDYAGIVEEARRLSGLYTLVGGHRSFDILHVATARVLKAGVFLSFGANQRKLAAAVGLNAAP